MLQIAINTSLIRGSYGGRRDGDIGGPASSGNLAILNRSDFRGSP
jgi:hypothetical protein